MPEEFDPDLPPPRGPLRTVVEFLKTYPVENSKTLIAKRIATGVYHSDSNEIVYWSTVGAAVSGQGLDPEVLAEVIPALQELGCYS